MKEEVSAPMLRFQEFNNNYRRLLLGEVFDSLPTGMTPSRTKKEYYRGSIPWITSGELDYRDVYETKENITENAVKETNLKLYPPGTLFIAITGLEAPGTRGRCAINGVTATTNQSCMAFQINETIHVRYLYYWYLLNGIRLYYRYAQGSKQQSFNAGLVKSFELSIPSLPEQQKIADFLTSVDKRIENLEKKKTLLETYKKGVMKKIFNQEIRFKDDDGNNFPDWEEKKLGTLLKHISKRNKSLEVELVLSVSNTRGFITQNEQFDKHRVASKDVSNYKVVSRNQFGYNPSRINVGSIALLKEYEVGIVSPMYVIFQTKKEIDSTYMEYLTQTHLFRHYVKVGCSGSVRDSLNFDEMEKFKFQFPSVIEQQKISSFLKSIDDQLNLLINDIEKSRTWKKGLLQKMFV